MPRINQPRIEALDPEQWSPEAREALSGTLAGGRPPLNIMRTLANHPQLTRRWLGFGSHVLSRDNTVPAREREIIILRTGLRCRSEYEFGQHTLIGQRAGLRDDEIKRLTADGVDPAWSERDAVLIRAADELHDDAFVSDATWEALARDWSVEQLMDIVFTVGQYTLVSMALNSFGVQLDEGVPGFPE